MENITTKIKGPLLTDFKSLGEMANYAWGVVKLHCLAEFNKSWASIEGAAHRAVTEEEFFRNYMWCVYVSGFSAHAVSRNYDKLLAAHNLVDDQGKFVPSSQALFPDKEKVFLIWRNRAKFAAITETRRLVHQTTWPDFHHEYLWSKSPQALQGLSFMGPALSRHLARNLGNVQIVKPDVHLVRLANRYNVAPQFAGIEEQASLLCEKAQKSVPEMAGWPLGKVDLALWYASATLRS